MVTGGVNYTITFFNEPRIIRYVIVSLRFKKKGMNLVPVNGLEILHKISFVPLKCHLNTKAAVSASIFIRTFILCSDLQFEA